MRNLTLGAIAAHLISICHVACCWADEPTSHSEFQIHMPPSAKELVKNGRYEEALPVLREEVRKDSHDARAHFSLASILLAAGHTEEGIEELHAAIRIGPDNATYQRLLAVGLVRLQRKDESLVAMRNAVRIDPSNPENHSSLACVLLSLDRAEEAISECREAVRLEPENLEYGKTLALSYLAAQHPDEAAAACDEMLKHTTDKASAFEDIGDVYGDMHRYDDSIRNFDSALAIRDSTRSRLGRGWALYRSGQSRKALDDYNKVLSDDPNNHEANAHRAFVNACLQNGKAAERDARKALETGTTHAALAYLVIGAIKNASGEKDLAAENFAKAIELEPNRILTYIVRALHRVKFDEWTLALADLDTAVDRAKDSDRLNFELDGGAWQVYKFRGIIHVSQMHNNSAAIRDFTSALKLNDRDADCYALRALAQGIEGNWLESSKDLNEAFKLSHDHAFAAYLAGMLWAACPEAEVRDGQLALGKASMACAMTKWKNPECLQALAAAKAETGNFEDAVLLQSSVVDNLEIQPTGSYRFEVWRGSSIDVTITIEKDDAEAALTLFRKNLPYRLTVRKPLTVIAPK